MRNVGTSWPGLVRSASPDDGPVRHVRPAQGCPVPV